jgi:hypothetical protein
MAVVAVGKRYLQMGFCSHTTHLLTEMRFERDAMLFTAG